MNRPSAPQARPNNSALRSPNDLTIGPMATPCTIIDSTPTAASVKPTVRTSQP